MGGCVGMSAGVGNDVGMAVAVADSSGVGVGAIVAVDSRQLARAASRRVLRTTSKRSLFLTVSLLGEGPSMNHPPEPLLLSCAFC
jgi:hypothetical protein